MSALDPWAAGAPELPLTEAEERALDRQALRTRRRAQAELNEALNPQQDKAPGVHVVVTVDEALGLALVQGSGSPRRIADLLYFSGVDRLRWSPAGGGWLMPAAKVDDLLGLAEWQPDITVAVQHRQRAEAAS